MLPAGPWDAVVVGSGVGGLATAATLARLGGRVLVLERHHAPGGLAQTFVRGPFRFDTGLHVLGELGSADPARRLLRRLAPTLGFRHLGPVADRIHRADGTLDLPSGASALVDSIERVEPGSRPAVSHFLRQARHAAHAAGTALLARSLPHALRHLVDPDTAARGEQLLRTPAAGWMDRQLGSGPAAALLGIRSGYHGTPWGSASAAAQAAVFHHYVEGAWEPVGGARALTTGLAAAVVEAGGWVCVGSPVAAIESGRVHLADGTEIGSRHIISAAGAHITARLLHGAPATWTDALDRLRPSAGHLGLYLGLSEDPQRFGATQASHWIPDALGIYVRFSTAGRPGPHRATVTRLVPGWRAPTGPGAYEGFKTRVVEELTAELERWFPGIRRTIVHAELSTPRTTERYTGAIGGPAYGLAATVERFACPHLRAVTPVPGVYQSGCDTGMSGIVGALMAGFGAACAVDPRALRFLAERRDLHSRRMHTAAPRRM